MSSSGLSTDCLSLVLSCLATHDFARGLRVSRVWIRAAQSPAAWPAPNTSLLQRHWRWRNKPENPQWTLAAMETPAGDPRSSRFVRVHPGRLQAIAASKVWRNLNALQLLAVPQGAPKRDFPDSSVLCAAMSALSSLRVLVVDRAHPVSEFPQLRLSLLPSAHRLRMLADTFHIGMWEDAVLAGLRHMAGVTVSMAPLLARAPDLESLSLHYVSDAELVPIRRASVTGRLHSFSCEGKRDMGPILFDPLESELDLPPARLSTLRVPGPPHSPHAPNFCYATCSNDWLECSRHLSTLTALDCFAPHSKTANWHESVLLLAAPLLQRLEDLRLVGERTALEGIMDAGLKHCIALRQLELQFDSADGWLASRFAALAALPHFELLHAHCGKPQLLTLSAPQLTAIASSRTWHRVRITAAVPNVSLLRESEKLGQAHCSLPNDAAVIASLQRHFRFQINDDEYRLQTPVATDKHKSIWKETQELAIEACKKKRGCSVQ